jgi:hypothetical protein
MMKQRCSLLGQRSLTVKLPVVDTLTDLGLGRTIGAVLSPFGGGGGGGEEMTKLLSAAGPTLPTWSIARTLTACVPPARPVYSLGLVQGWNGPLLRLHSNLAPASLENVTRAVVPLTVTPPMVVAGAEVSTS